MGMRMKHTVNGAHAFIVFRIIGIFASTEECERMSGGNEQAKYDAQLMILIINLYLF